MFFCVSVFLSVEKADAQVFNRPHVVGINWNAECALQAAQGYALCRQNGGRNWPCAVAAGLSYWNCSGSNFESSFRRVSKVRAGFIGARLARRHR